MKISYKLIYSLAISLFLSGCGPTPQELANQQMQQRKSAAFSNCTRKYPSAARSASNAKPFAMCIINVLNNYGGTDIDWLIANKRLQLAEKLSNGSISLTDYNTEFQTFIYQLKTQQQILATQQAIAKNTHCISERQRVAGSNYSGIDSTNGFVAVTSLLAAVGDAAAVSSACN
jgi:hypothetical protein